MWRYSPTSDIFSYWRYEQIFDCLILWNKSSEIVRQVYYLVVWTPSNDFRQQSTYKWWWRLISSRSSPHSTSFFLLVNRQDGSPLFPNFSSIADDGKPTLMGPTAFNCSIHQNTSNYINSINVEGIVGLIILGANIQIFSLCQSYPNFDPFYSDFDDFDPFKKTFIVNFALFLIN